MMKGWFELASVKRTKTNYQCIYKNERTGRYDVKYNYKIYDAITDTTSYKSRWSTGHKTISEAKSKLAEMRNEKSDATDEAITLRGAYELWRYQRSTMSKISPVTIRNTEQHMRMLSKFINLDMYVRDITPQLYIKLCSDLKLYGYSEETLHSINSTFRKLINLCYQQKLISENILDYCDNLHTDRKDASTYRLIYKDEFDKLDAYLRDNKFVRLGIDAYPKYRLIVNILYFTGIRIGEVLALTRADIDIEHKRISVTKAYVSDFKLTKSPKNLKHRKIPIPDNLARLCEQYFDTYTVQDTQRLFDITHSAVTMMLKTVCTKICIDNISCHDFRHTYITNLIRNSVPLATIERISGDTQQTILQRYSNFFIEDDTLVIDVLDNL